MIEKCCFQCGVLLKFSDFCYDISLTLEERMRVWESPYTQFFCCVCYGYIQEFGMTFQTQIIDFMEKSFLPDN